MTSILVIPDCHVEPGQNMRRADWLGEFIKDRKPDVIVHIGDLAEMASLSSYDTIKDSAYLQDCAAAAEFMSRVVKKSGNVWKNTRTIFLEGNHEDRIRRFVGGVPELEGVMSLGDLGVYQFFKEVNEWHGGPAIVEIEGILFAHFFANRMGRAIGGINQGRSMLINNMKSSVCGHTHLLNYSTVPLPDGLHRHALVAGCFFEHHQDFAGQSNAKYWRGVAMLHDCKNGEFDLELISLHRLRKEYK